ncbi:RNA-directed DNA polymerase from mobile element jockey [Trichonephila clavipes]|nr:RNA-directed DNA polymerase from mobile element jockey [Trichonephila clavipes]
MTPRPSEIFDCSDKNTIFLGDLNAKHQSWGCFTNNDRGNDLLNAADDRALIFLNSGLPTHTSFNYGTSEALDITLVSPEIHPLCDWDMLSSIGSEQIPILINVQINRKTVTSHKKFWNFKKANWDCFQRITECSFDKRTTMDNLEQEWHSFKQVIIHASKQPIPRSNFKHLKSYFQHRDPGLRTLIFKRNALHRKLTLTGDREDNVELNKLNVNIKQLYITLKRKAWTCLCSNIDAKTPNTKLWKLAQSLSLSYNQRQNMPCNTVLTSDGKAAPHDKFAANVLGEFYKGPDGIHEFMIGHLGPHGMQKLLDIFNFSWKIGRLPRDWKRAIIIPILKPGKDTSTSASNRPIALTSFVCKLMERLVLARLKFHLNIGGLLPSEQYVYRKGIGAVDQILYFCQRIRDYKRKSPSPWISDFLWDRSIRVKYNNFLSDPFAIRQGVPQGSVLSPVLFSLYITGIEKVLAKYCEVGIFANDIIVWSSGSDVGENELKLNRAIEEAHSFAEMHKLIFNASKSLTTFFSTNRHLFNYQPKISMNGIQLCYVKNANYLGYTLDQEITSNKHIEGQVTKLCDARIITGLRYSCQIDIVLFESNLPSLSKRRLYSLTRYFNKLYSYNEQHRTSAYLHAWINNRRLMKHSPFSYARTLNLPSSDVEPYSLSFTGAGLELDGIYFHDQLLTSVTKSSEIPALVNQLALEIHNLP